MQEIVGDSRARRLVATLATVTRGKIRERRL
jgi:hypothetical protein